MRIIALDYGEKRVGAAVGNSELKTGVPIKGLTRTKRGDVINFVEKLVGEYEPDIILIGQPLNMDGTPSRLSAIVEKFADKVRNKFKLEVKLIDERLSSFEAEEMINSYKASLKKEKNIVDSISALIILNRYLGV